MDRRQGFAARTISAAHAPSSLSEQSELPDAVFVEDVAIVLDEVAVLTRPGAPSRRPEVASVADLLRHYRPLHAIEAPATLDGGDVLCMGRTLYVGESARSSPAGIAQLRELQKAEGAVTCCSLVFRSAA